MSEASLSICRLCVCVSVRFKTARVKKMPLNIRIRWNAGTACVSECVQKKLARRGLPVGPSKLEGVAAACLVQNMQDWADQKLLGRGPEVFLDGAFFATFSSPHTLCTPYHGPTLIFLIKSTYHLSQNNYVTAPYFWTINFGRRNVKIASRKLSWNYFGRRYSYRGFEWFPYRNVWRVWGSGRINFWRRNVILHLGKSLGRHACRTKLPPKNF